MYTEKNQIHSLQRGRHKTLERSTPPKKPLRSHRDLSAAATAKGRNFIVLGRSQALFMADIWLYQAALLNQTLCPPS